MLLLETIVQIQRGQSTPTFERKPNPKMEHLSFSLLYRMKNDNYGSLDIVNKDESEHLLWLVGLRALLPKVKFQSRIKDRISEVLSGTLYCILPGFHLFLTQILHGRCTR